MTHKSKAKKRAKRECYAVAGTYSERDLRTQSKADFSPHHGTYARAQKEVDEECSHWSIPVVIYRWKQGRGGGRGRWVRVGDPVLECPT